MQEESSSVVNTPAQEGAAVNEKSAAEATVSAKAEQPVNDEQSSDVKKQNKKSAKKKGPKIPTVNEIVEKVAADDEAEKDTVEEKKSESKESDAKQKPAADKTPAADEKSDAAEKSEYPDEDEDDSEATARARANLNLDSETALVETVLFLESEPQNTESLAKITQLSADVITEALTRLREKYANADSGIEIAEIIGGWMLVPKKEEASILSRKNTERRTRAA